MPGLPPQNADTNDPVKALAEILKCEKLDENDKQVLHEMAMTRFTHRRHIAYIALFGMFVVAVIEAFAKVDMNSSWLYPTLTAIVAAYYGASAYKPNS